MLEIISQHDMACIGNFKHYFIELVYIIDVVERHGEG